MIQKMQQPAAAVHHPMQQQPAPPAHCDDGQRPPLLLQQQLLQQAPVGSSCPERSPAQTPPSSPTAPASRQEEHSFGLQTPRRQPLASGNGHMPSQAPEANHHVVHQTPSAPGFNTLSSQHPARLSPPQFGRDRSDAATGQMDNKAVQPLNQAPGGSQAGTSGTEILFPASSGSGQLPGLPAQVPPASPDQSHIKRKARSGPKSRTSPYIGVSQYKRTGRWEAHIWDSAEGQDKKGRQLHLGSFLTAIQAARAYDRAALVLRGHSAHINFPASDYLDDPVLSNLMGLGSKKQMVAVIRTTQDQQEEQEAAVAFAAAEAAAEAESEHLRNLRAEAHRYDADTEAALQARRTQPKAVRTFRRSHAAPRSKRQQHAAPPVTPLHGLPNGERGAPEFPGPAAGSPMAANGGAWNGDGSCSSDLLSPAYPHPFLGDTGRLISEAGYLRLSSANLYDLLQQQSQQLRSNGSQDELSHLLEGPEEGKAPAGSRAGGLDRADRMRSGEARLTPDVRQQQPELHVSGMPATPRMLPSQGLPGSPAQQAAVPAATTVPAGADGMATTAGGKEDFVNHHGLGLITSKGPCGPKRERSGSLGGELSQAGNRGAAAAGSPPLWVSNGHDNAAEQRYSMPSPSAPKMMAAGAPSQQTIKTEDSHMAAGQHLPLTAQTPFGQVQKHEPHGGAWTGMPASPVRSPEKKRRRATKQQREEQQQQQQQQQQQRSWVEYPPALHRATSIPSGAATPAQIYQQQDMAHEERVQRQVLADTAVAEANAVYNRLCSMMLAQQSSLPQDASVQLDASGVRDTGSGGLLSSFPDASGMPAPSSLQGFRVAASSAGTPPSTVLPAIAPLRIPESVMTTQAGVQTASDQAGMQRAFSDEFSALLSGLPVPAHDRFESKVFSPASARAPPDYRMPPATRPDLLSYEQPPSSQTPVSLTAAPPLPWPVIEPMALPLQTYSGGSGRTVSGSPGSCSASALTASLGSQQALTEEEERCLTEEQEQKMEVQEEMAMMMDMLT